MDWDKLPLTPEDLFGNFLDIPHDEDDGPFEAIIMPVRDLVVYPQMVTPLYLGHDVSIHALEVAIQEDWPLVVVAQHDTETDEFPDAEDLYEVGAEVIIARSIRLPDGSTSAIVQGVQRVKILEYTQRTPYLMANVLALPETFEESAHVEALTRAVLTMFEKAVDLNQALPEEAYVYAMNV
ncbi:MAG: LON peptidase substrate-binding domain-containing protein, partial [Anaerolineae bacterium]|nr:LON peptidase substrate-binding domain-containing protein [Anaerolineae bacterium]